MGTNKYIDDSGIQPNKFLDTQNGEFQVAQPVSSTYSDGYMYGWRKLSNKKFKQKPILT